MGLGALLVASGALVPGCGGAEGRGGRGDQAVAGAKGGAPSTSRSASSGGRGNVGSAGASDAAPTRFVLAGLLPSLRQATVRSRSEHLSGELEGEVLVNEAAQAYPALGPQRGLPVGAMLLERHLVRGSEAPVVYFGMVKRAAGFDAAGGDWEYLVVSPAGQIAPQGLLCGRCHAEAPHDHLFGASR